MLATIPSATLLGVTGLPVRVEAHVSNGLPGYTVVGLPDAACRESRERVRAALLSSKLPWPQQRATVNLAPSGLRKVGSGLDLAIAMALLVASKVLPTELVAGVAFVGELGLDGSVRPVPGVLSLVDAIDVPTVVVPAAAAAEASLVGRHAVRAVSSLPQLLGALRGVEPWPDPPPPPPAPPEEPPPDLADVRGQPVARAAVEVAAAGGHHLLLVGPPGAGKTMLARRLPGILPPLQPDEALECTRIRSAAGLAVATGLVPRPPLRCPHHTVSTVAMVGGGSAALRPGEASLAHCGVLFLDELGECARSVLEALREPLEEGAIHIARATHRVTLPARFLLVGATNPCPCGGDGGPVGCRCSDARRAQYHRRLSGPLLDRFDLRVAVARPDVTELLGTARGEPSSAVAARVVAARERARKRGVRANVELRGSALAEHAPLDTAAERLLEVELRAGRMSARGLDRTRAVARTIADLHGAGRWLEVEHVALALGLRAATADAELRWAS